MNALVQYSYFGARYYDSDLSVWLNVDPMADKYPSTSAYMFVLGNPIILRDPNGMSAVGPDEWDYDISTRKMTWVSNKGRSERQYVNIVSNGKQIGEGSMEGNEVFVYKLRNSVALTNNDMNFNDENYNRNNNYEYTSEEFKIRSKLFKNDSPLKRFIQIQEREGKAPPISYNEEEKLYGYTVMRLRMIAMAISCSFDVMPSPLSTPTVSKYKSSKTSGYNLKYASTSSSNLKGYKGVKSLTGNSSWNRFLHANKGVFSGKGWQKRAAEAYYKSSY